MPCSVPPPGTRRVLVFTWRPAGRRTFASLHRHEGEEWILLRRGRLRMLAGGRPVDLRPGDLLRLTADGGHAVLEASADCTKWVIWAGMAADNAADGPAVRHLAARDLRDLDQCCRLAEAHHGEDAGEILAQAAAACAAGFWRRAATGRPAEAVHPAVAQACRILADRGGAVALDLVAAGSGMSRSRLSHLFTRQTGVRLVEFRNRCRLERFVQLRAERPQTALRDLARSCGFTSCMQFYRMHRRLLGAAPAAGG